MKKRLLQFLQVLIVSLISYYMIFLSSFVSMSDFRSVLPFFNSLIGLKIITFIFVVGVYLLLLSITNLNWLSTAIALLLSVIFAFINHIKIVLRNEPFLPGDLRMANSLPQLIHMITIKDILLIVFGVVVVVGLCILVFRKKQLHFFQSRKSRLITFILSLIVSVGFVSISFSNSPVHKMSVALNNDPFYWDPVWGVKRNGPILNFVNYINTKTMEKPDGYSKETMQRLAKKYEQKSSKINKKRKSIGNTDIVMVLSESFSDPNHVKGIKLNSDPLPFTHSIMKSNPSGTMISNGYGGGTANMEFQALTSLALGNYSMTLTTPYTQLVPKMQAPYTVNNLFKDSIAIHPYSSNLYNRKMVLKKFGFSKFYTQDGPDHFPYKTTAQKNPYISDDAVYKDVVNQVKENRGNTFYHVITMQNHVPYSAEYYPNNNFKAKGKISKSERQQIETFAEGVNLTDQANKKLINQLKNVKKNVIVIFYGDHLPGIYEHADFNKDGILMHETPYFIWSNHLKLNKDAAPSLVGPYAFSNVAYNAANFKVSPYYVLMNEVTNELPIITTNMLTKESANVVRTQIQLVSQKDHKLVSQSILTKKQKQILYDYQLVQYDLSAGKHYLTSEFTK
ncbi:LTA synthase family protein [Xylocopilactobacillus apis]|uniref:Sulfatase N-terminal domain-containing protein n=1 Tax=Xylocopilactobacillus apis TaxID=2932183 RepID=A0AAU9CYW1_9LACO|nr:alkaline phosphatase family protein [Xylocopilactobacillus apis]BDR56604.1 hypothetical protein KIMC2_11660 [Xylocopilactobacillus apis]